jgi:adenine-specific DNA-methyltransferase
MTEELHPKTLEYINQAEIEFRKNLGQYFTIKTIRNILIDNLPKEFLEKTNLKILDPACGTGEFLLSCKERFNTPNLIGWDIDENVLNICKSLIPESKTDLKNTLIYDTEDKYDLIIGNPPYFEFKPDDSIKKRFNNLIKGRTNIYGLFVSKCLDLLKEGGFLAFVIPPSMNNGSYFSNLRKKIMAESNIHFLKILDSSSFFHGANQTVMLIILQKIKNKGDYIFEKNGITIFSEDVEYLKNTFNNTFSLKELGYEVKTGRIVWNQNKEKLTNTKTDIPLIWSQNIVNNELVLNNNSKRMQYLNYDYYDKGPAIVVNRIVGQAGKGKIKAALIPENYKFLAENHVNVIFKRKDIGLKSYSNENNYKLSFENILKQLNSKEKTKIIQKITGNTQLSKTELENLFPFDVK